MAALLDDGAAADDEDAIRVLHGGQAVGDDHDGSLGAGDGRINGLLDEMLRFRVQRRRGLRTWACLENSSNFS